MMVIRKYRFPLVNIKYDVRVINRKHKQTDDDQSRRSVTMQMLYFSINVYLMKYFTTAYVCFQDLLFVYRIDMNDVAIDC
jgi:hypothetical protein